MHPFCFVGCIGCARRIPTMSSTSGHYTVDPAEMESRFSEGSGLGYLDSILIEPTEDDQEQIDHVRAVLDQLPPREADFVDLYYFKRLRQTDIAAIFGVSQPTVCYRLARAADRIRFLINLPRVEKEDMEKDLAGFLSDPLDVQIMIQMWVTTCQSEVAKRLGVSQGLVRHRFLRALTQMRQNAKLVKYVVLFTYISANLNILR
jgi:DNA-directed RNA polymerase specialized sigma24 family protein